MIIKTLNFFGTDVVSRAPWVKVKIHFSKVLDLFLKMENVIDSITHFFCIHNFVSWKNICVCVCGGGKNFFFFYSFAFCPKRDFGEKCCNSDWFPVFPRS